MPRFPRLSFLRIFPTAAARPAVARGGLICLFLFALAPLASAQSVRWEPPAGTLASGQTSELALVFSDCSPDGEVALPVVANVQFGRPSQSSETSIINFKMSQRVSLVYPVIPVGSTAVDIPAFEVATDKGRVQVAAAHYDVGAATVGSSGVALDRVANSEISTASDTLWAGETFDVNYRLLISRRYNPTNVGNLEWPPPAGLVLENWNKPEIVNETIGGEPRVRISTHARAYAKLPGDVTLPPARQLIDLQTGQQGWGLLSRPSIEQFLVTSTAPKLHVKPLPLPAPASFLKAVGTFTFESKVVPEKAAVGDPITWTLSLAGTGNWPDGLTLPPREVSRDFQTIRPQTQRTIKEGTMFDGSLTEDVVLIPTKPGTYTLGPVSFAYFDPKAGTYQTIRTTPITVRVAPAPSAATDGSSAAHPVFQFTPNAADNGVGKSPAPTLPGGLPLEPLLGMADTQPPFARLAPWLIFTPLAPLLLLWLALGQRRALLNDPRRSQRLAARELPVALKTVAAARTPEEKTAALRLWQSTAGKAWGTGSAAPTAAAVARAILREARGRVDAAAWERLWLEADAFLYGRTPKLPDDWAARAAVAAKSVRLPRRPLFAALRPSSLWPASLALFLAFGLPRPAAADVTTEAYQRGEFNVAEQAWRVGLAREPGDWKTRHNLGLALAQKNHWSEAAAHWGAAFLAAPRDPTVRFDLALGLSKAEFTQPDFNALSAGEGAARLARLASPREWQLTILAGALTVGLALAIILLDRHFGPRRWRLALAIILAATGVLAQAGGFFALRIYGPLANPQAVLLWHATDLRSIPTEAGEQKTEPLAAGTIAVGIKSFFGWEQLAFPNGQTGWVRHDNLVYLYR